MTELPPLPANTRSADAGGVTIRVAPLLTDEESQELFEANLPLSGVLPLRVELAFQSGVPVELKRARFRLRDSQNREWKLLVAEERHLENHEGQWRVSLQSKLAQTIREGVWRLRDRSEDAAILQRSRRQGFSSSKLPTSARSFRATTNPDSRAPASAVAHYHRKAHKTILCFFWLTG